MKKWSVGLIIGLATISFPSTAQMSFGAGLGIIRPTTNGAKAYFGGELTAKYDITEQFRAGVNLGYYQRSDKSGTVKVSSSLAPVSVSGEYLFVEETKSFRPYAGLHLGLLRDGYKVSNGGTNKLTNSFFSLAPVLGFDYGLGGNVGLNFNFKYGVSFYRNTFTNKTESFSMISPNIGITYRLH
jgi:outer membrane protein W